MNKTLLCRVAAKIFVCVFWRNFPEIINFVFRETRNLHLRKSFAKFKGRYFRGIEKHESFLIFLTC